MVPTSVGLRWARVGARLVNVSGRCSFFCEAGEEQGSKIPRAKEGIMYGLWRKCRSGQWGSAQSFDRAVQFPEYRARLVVPAARIGRTCRGRKIHSARAGRTLQFTRRIWSGDFEILRF
jgi:hypothetical protein